MKTDISWDVTQYSLVVTYVSEEPAHFIFWRDKSGTT
jgi:hypothetical protein